MTFVVILYHIISWFPGYCTTYVHWETIILHGYCSGKLIYIFILYFRESVC